MAFRAKAISACVAVALCASSCGPHKPSPPSTTQPIATPRELAGIREFAWVTPYLSRGGQPDSVGFEELKKAGVKAVIDLRGKSHRDAIDTLAVKYLQVPTNVTQPDRQQIVEFLRMVRDPVNRPIFVHDEAGADRVGLYIAAFRMVEQGWTFRDAQVEMDRFHFNMFWKQVPVFLEHLDLESIRKDLSIPPASQPTTQKKSRS